jgi:hypothetical protein
MFIWLKRNRNVEKKQKGMKSNPMRKTKTKKEKEKKNTLGAGGFFKISDCYVFFDAF